MSGAIPGLSPTRSAAFVAGLEDKRQRTHARWWLLQVVGVTDAELSDYWHGWHRGKPPD